MLINQLPQFVQEYREIKEIMSATEPELDSLAGEISQLKSNQFMSTCNEDGIAEFEKLLSISPTTEDTLAARIARVIMSWNDGIPYTYRGLCAKLEAICGAGNYEVAPKFDKYELEIVIYAPFAGDHEELKSWLDMIIPANIMELITYQSQTLICGVKLGGMLGGSLLVTTLTEAQPTLSFSHREYVAGALGHCISSAKLTQCDVQHGFSHREYVAGALGQVVSSTQLLQYEKEHGFEFTQAVSGNACNITSTTLTEKEEENL